MIATPQSRAMFRTTAWAVRTARATPMRTMPSRAQTNGRIADPEVSVLTPPMPNDTRQRLVIIGSGWAGYNVLRGIDHNKYKVVVVSPRGYFVFTPLLASCAVGTLEFSAVVEPVRGAGKPWFKLDTLVLQKSRLLRRLFGSKVSTDDYEHVKLVQSNARAVDFERKRVYLGDAAAKAPTYVPYDKLVIAAGCRSQTFGIPGVREYAHFLKDITDAFDLRKKVLACFEAASMDTASIERKRELLNFCIVGGGPTGVEYAAELHDLVQEDLTKYFPDLIQHVRITIFDVAKGILTSFDEKLSGYAEEHFRRQQIRVRGSVHVTEVRPNELVLEGGSEVVKYGVLLWSTGLAPSELVANITDVVKDPKGSIVTDEFLRVLRPGPHGTVVDRNVYALGDCAQIRNGLLPATAQVATQKATYLFKRLNQTPSSDLERFAPFAFKNRGVMAYIGGWQAIVQGQNNEVKGRTAWLLWRGAYMSMSVSIRNKILIPTLWFLSWMFGRDISRF
ncbi:pyridine nucleotide-disulfide oxidoreductase-domain-containing protein [Dipodascopsis tothii]|uniref:pyridine nucleotide-disulfide oxidoreductase-domain-containing protein n=1 Tax=Dipodascopsis tothii TaxID=44089 RepID=UPI0034CD13C1